MSPSQDAWAGLQEVTGCQFQSALLRSMAAGGAFVDMRGPLKELLGYTDWDLAAERGRIVPHPGSEASFDAAEQQVGRTPDVALLLTCPTWLKAQPGRCLNGRQHTTPVAAHDLPWQEPPI